MGDDNHVEIRDIRERLIRIETLLELMTKTKETADSAEKLAIQALQANEENKREIDGLKKFLMWAAGIGVPAFIALATTVITVIF